MVRHSTDKDLHEKDAELLHTLEEWGWFVIKVGAGDAEPAFAYSIGLYENFKHPEIILFGLDLGVMHRLINDVGKRIREGQRFDEARRYDDFFKGYQCEFRNVNPSRYEGLLTYDIWYYKRSPFPVLQMIWPDRGGLFPWEEGFDEGFRKEQPILD